MTWRPQIGFIYMYKFEQVYFMSSMYSSLLVKVMTICWDFVLTSREVYLQRTEEISYNNCADRCAGVEEVPTIE